ncbi:MAG: MFS transporter [Alphaproteobacteria bacterium]|nr:MFS transporter [Alphaproteobacteria bacterium]
MTSTPTSSAGRGRALAAWLIAALFFFYAFLQRVSPSVMVEELMRDFAVGAAVLGHLSAFYFYAYAGLQIPIGVLLDRLGPRRLTTAAAALCAVGSLIFAIADSVALASLGRFLIGAGAAFSWIGALTVITQWLPPQRFALMGGLTQAIGMLGAIFGQAPLALAVGSVGWRLSVMALAGLAVAFTLALWLAIRDRPHKATASFGIGEGLRRVAGNPQTWLAALFGMTMTGPMLAFAGLWGVPWLTTVHGMDRASAAATLSLMFVGWAIGAPLLGGLSDRWRRRKPVMAGGSLLAGLALAALLYLPGLSPAAMAALIAAHGFGASCMVLAFVSAREHNPDGLSSSTYGVINTAVIASGALLQPLLGLLLDLNWDGSLAAGTRAYSEAAYGLAFAVLPVGCMVGTLAALLARESYPHPLIEKAR